MHGPDHSEQHSYNSPSSTYCRTDSRILHLFFVINTHKKHAHIYLYQSQCTAKCIVKVQLIKTHVSNEHDPSARLLTFIQVNSYSCYLTGKPKERTLSQMPLTVRHFFLDPAPFLNLRHIKKLSLNKKVTKT